MNKKTANKLRDIIKQKKESGEMRSNRVLINPENPVDLIKKRLCRVFVEFYIENKSKISLSEYSKMLEIDKSKLSLIINYYIDDLSIDCLVELLMKLAPKSEKARSALQRIILAA